MADEEVYRPNFVNAKLSEERALQDMAAFENELVQHMLVMLGAIGYKRQILDSAVEAGGKARLTLAAFNEVLPAFPILLRATSMKGVTLHTDNRCTLPALFKNFVKAPFVTEYTDYADEVHHRANGRAIGLIFRRHGILKGLILHDGGLENYWAHGTVLSHRTGDRNNPVTLHLQPFTDLIRGIAADGWQP